jgi:uncharacterized C2H2 Zn-finger protein
MDCPSVKLSEANVAVFICTLGSKDFIKANILRVLDAHGLPIYQCSFCAHQTRLSANLAKHIEARHMESGGVVCPHCDKLFNSRNSLQSHVSRKHRRTPEAGAVFMP